LLNLSVLATNPCDPKVTMNHEIWTHFKAQGSDAMFCVLTLP